MMPPGNPRTRTPPRSVARAVSRPSETPARGVVITGIDVSMGDLMMLLIKLAIASIPATIILTAIGVLIFGILAAIRGA